MSDASVLSHEYKTASELSEMLNTELVALKKARHTLPGSELLTTKGLETSRSRLADIVRATRELLHPIPQMAAKPRFAQIPGGLVDRLRVIHRGDLPYFLQDLEQLERQLCDKSVALADLNFDAIDRLAAVADAEASRVFRRLMRV